MASTKEISLTLILAFIVSLAWAGEPPPGHIENFEKQLQDTTARPTPKKSKKPESSESSLDSLESDIWTTIFLGALIGTYYTFGYVPDEIDDFYDGEVPRLSPYPYYNQYAGRFCSKEDVPSARLSAFQVSGGYFLNSSSLNGGELSLQYFVHPMLELNYSSTYINEKRPEGRDRIIFDSYMVNYRRFRWPAFDFSWGVGMMNCRGDRVYRGFSGNLGMDVYPGRPLSLSGWYTVSRLGERWVSEFRFDLRAHYRRFMVNAGYHTFQARSATLEGLILGAGIYF